VCSPVWRLCLSMHAQQFLDQESQHLQLVICTQLREFLQLKELESVGIVVLVLKVDDLLLLGNEHLLLALNLLLFAVQLHLVLLLRNCHSFLYDL